MNSKDKKRLEKTAARLEVECTFLTQCIEYGAIELEEVSSSVELPPSQAARLRRLQRICRSLDVDVFAGCIIVDLLDQMEEMRRDLQSLR